MNKQQNIDAILLQQGIILSAILLTTTFSPFCENILESTADI